MSLLDDLQEELVSEALAKPAAPPPPKWMEPVSWKFTGYLARCTRYVCKSCQGATTLPQGIFSEEVASNGTRKLAAAAQFPMQEVKRMEITWESIPHCDECLISLGFMDMVDAPEVRTHIAGVGLLGVPRKEDS